ncbi:hypothetical protein C2E23DRAFT_260256 [Lenzites betulinus]|nr:hypothetical protein C2E23DRAFT_260256 [Lenzites betulinus]
MLIQHSTGRQECSQHAPQAVLFETYCLRPWIVMESSCREPLVLITGDHAPGVLVVAETGTALAGNRTFAVTSSPSQTRPDDGDTGVSDQTWYEGSAALPSPGSRQAHHDAIGCTRECPYVSQTSEVLVTEPRRRRAKLPPREVPRGARGWGMGTHLSRPPGRGGNTPGSTAPDDRLDVALYFKFVEPKGNLRQRARWRAAQLTSSPRRARAMSRGLRMIVPCLPGTAAKLGRAPFANLQPAARSHARACTEVLPGTASYVVKHSRREGANTLDF